jgi:energy-coupling factor transport system permease protein
VGIVVAAVLVAASAVDPTDLHPSLQPLRWPDLPVPAALAIALGALPAWLAPPAHLRAANPPVPHPMVEQAA